MDYAAHFKKWNYEGIRGESIIVEPNDDLLKIGLYDNDLDALMFCTNYMQAWWQKYSNEHSFKRNKITLEDLWEINHKEKPIRTINVFAAFSSFADPSKFNMYSFNQNKKLEFKISELYKPKKSERTIEITRNEDNRLKIIINKK